MQATQILMHPPEQGTSRFWDRIAKKYARTPVPDEAVYQKKLQISRQYFGPDSQILEIGCGTGSTAIAHAPYVANIRATDISANMLEIAQGKAQAAGVGNVQFEQAAINELDLSTESFDAVLGLSILHLVDDWQAVIAEMYRALKPGGVFITSTACIGNMMKLLPLVLPVMKLFRLAPMVKVFTIDELKRGFRDAGFEIEYDWQPGKGKALFMVARKPA